MNNVYIIKWLLVDRKSGKIEIKFVPANDDNIISAIELERVLNESIYRIH